MKRTSLRYSIGGMSCAHCEQTIERGLLQLDGVESVKASFSKGTADVVFDADRVSRQALEETVARLGYTTEGGTRTPASDSRRTAGLLLVIAALFLLLQATGLLNFLAPSRLAQAGMSLGALFVIGLVTSVHCVAMCGGINLSQCVSAGNAPAGKGSALKPSLLYNAGRVISYTAVGFAVGALGGVITFSPAAQGALKLLAGLFMVLMGINMLGIFPRLRRFNPRMPRFIARRIDAQKWRSNSPLIVGLLNGLMPCGPLQAMQIYALSTGSAVTGALSMLLFSLGTVPLMFGLGALSSILSRKFTRRMLAVGAVMVVVLGLSMLSQGVALTGVPSSVASAQTETLTNPEAAPVVASGAQVVRSMLTASAYPDITVQAGVPVQWIINAPDGSINGCNGRMFIPEYNIEYTFVPGDNLIEFTPAETGTFRYTCWMGMITATITVVEPETDSAGTDAAQSVTLLSQAEEIGGPVPAGYVIPTDALAVAEQTADEAGNPLQRAMITLTDTGFVPAVVVAQKGIRMEWTIVNERAAITAIWVPKYASQIALPAGSNLQALIPTTDFDFFDGSQTFYGFVKVVDDLNAADLEAIKTEVSLYETLRYPASYFQSAAGSCCTSP